MPAGAQWRGPTASTPGRPPGSRPTCRADRAKTWPEAITMTARIVDTPCNEMNTDAFVEEAKRVASELGIVPTIIRGEELRERGFGGIYGVGKAAAHPPALVVLSHKPAKTSKAIAWVGKGIVYDTGGLSIKTKTGMRGAQGAGIRRNIWRW